MEKNEIIIEKLDGVYDIIIDGVILKNVTDYKIISTAHNGAELIIHINLNENISRFETLAMTSKRYKQN